MAAPTFPTFCCSICEVEAVSEEQLREHCLGQRHFYNVRQRDNAQRSVYVKGFPRGAAAEGEVRAVFQQFGPIHKIVIDSKGLFVIVEFSNVDSALSVLQYTCPLLISGTPVVVKPREFKLKQRGKKAAKTDVSSSTTTSDDSFVDVSMDYTPASDPLSLDDSSIQQILSTTSVDDQIHLLVSKCTDHSLAQKGSRLVSYLQTHFSAVFPNCRVLPFGSMVTGLATPTSDLDAVLLTDWNETDEQYFGSSDWFTNTDSAASHDNDDEDSMMETGVSEAPPTISLHAPPNVKVVGGGNLDNCSCEYRMATSVLASAEDCNKVLAVVGARCPIVQFVHRPSSLHCDLSVNTRLGIHNTRLLKSYLHFDPRVLPCLFVLRWWVRACGISCSQINNYCLALMFIYSLQRMEPPILPSLQSPGLWKVNMSCYSEREVNTSMARGVADLMIDGWKVGFMEPQSLMPSSNTATLGDILLHFFKFFSENFSFDTNAVAIQTPVNQILTINEASSMASSLASLSLPHKLRTMKINAMCVQDPMELTHNVAKSTSFATLSLFTGMLKKAAQMMTALCDVDSSDAGVSILDLFKLNEPSAVTIQTGPISGDQQLCFSLSKVTRFLSKISQFADLVSLIETIDFSSQSAQDNLCLVVLKGLVVRLEDDLGFKCTEGGIVSGSDTESPLSTLSDTFIIPSIVQPTAIPDRKRQRDPLTASCGLEDTFEHQHEDGERLTLKRLKSSVHTSSPDEVLYRHASREDGQKYPSTVLCQAHAKTWQNRRQARRHHQLQVDSAPLPVLQFTMSVTSRPKNMTSKHNRHTRRDMMDALVYVQMEAGDAYLAEFYTFFAFFKKFIS